MNKKELELVRINFYETIILISIILFVFWVIILK